MLGAIYTDDSSELPYIGEEDGGGEVRKLGCLLPESFPTGLKSLGEAVELLDEAAIRKILDDKDRLPARERFGERFQKDQRNLGSCNGQAATSALERIRVTQGMEYVELWPEALYAQMNGGRDGGSALEAAFKKLPETGVPPQSAANGNKFVYLLNDIPRDAWEQAQDYRVQADEIYFVDTEQELATALALGFYCDVAVQAGGSFSRMDGDGVCLGGNGPGNHAVLVDDVRYSTTKGRFEFDMDNSWGLQFGLRGRMWLFWQGQLRQTVKNHRFFAVRAALDPRRAA